MRDRVNQTVLGVFVGIFAYCLVVLRTIRGGDEGAFVPSLAVLVGLLLAFVGIAYLIYFIHHISLSIQAASIIASVADETITAVDRLFPDRLGESEDRPVESELQTLEQKSEEIEVNSLSTGYVESVDGDALLNLADEMQTVIRMQRGVGDFVINGTALVSLEDPNLEDDRMHGINALFVISRQRTVQQDAAFGIRQISDIALKALSPGINDTTTAVMCIDYLAAILVHLASRKIPSAYRYKNGTLRLVARGATFESLVSEAFDQVRQNAAGNVAVLVRQVEALDVISRAIEDSQRKSCIRRQVELIWIVAESTVPAHEIAPIKQQIDKLIRNLPENGRVD